MKTALVLLLVIHGLIHLLGVAKGFGLAEVAQLKMPVGRGGAVLWLLATLALLATAGMRLWAPAHWWMVGVGAVVISQVAIVTSWGDAKFGSLANVLVSVALVVAVVDLRSGSLRSRYRQDVRAIPPATSTPMTDGELSKLPAPVQKYLRRVGVVGRPHVRDLRVRLRGQLRNGRDSGWMKVDIEQHSSFGEVPTRFFFLEGSMFGVPFDGYHRFVVPTATMEIRILGLFPIVEGRGPQMDRSETVTLLNDMCLLAPATLVDADIEWRVVDERRVDATFHQIKAELYFDAEGDLVDFASNDRLMSADGKTFASYRWSTPIRDYRDFGGARLAAYGEAIWALPDGPFPYARFDLDQVAYNVAR